VTFEPFERVSGHRPAPTRSIRAADLPEHDWTAARDRVYPLLQPRGTGGTNAAQLPGDVAPPGKGAAEPIVSPGPCDLVVGFGIQAVGFDVLVNAEHLGAWGLAFPELQTAAMQNLAAWSEKTSWTDESSGQRRLLSSDSGQGYDASRILLAEVREYLGRELTEASEAGTRVLVGLPDRHLLVAGSLAADDTEFVVLFRDFVLEQADAADEPVDRRVFEISAGELVEFQP
jgi:hypothetical protein